ncbi:uncharacterized protein LOC110066146 isoform X2 [Orbicella faveolata]|uniref:uncharacterized protein LOC110066146 isoform X2 n=1 Tax=Orbicella faveolata TaxID=48498 RepID=UPI0009E272F4|nr:uncharacterized protein LOC110066146 isoform X2 [Orbicella faveolata]
MSSKGGRRSRGAGRKRYSGDAFVDELRQEVNSSLAAEKDVSEAFRQLCSVQISLDSIRSLPAKVLSVYLHAKFDERVRDFVTSSLAELDILPNSMRNISVANLTGLSEYEASLLYEACSVVSKASPPYSRSLQNVDISSRGFPVLLTPPIGVCIVCSDTLSEHNKTCDVTIYGLLGKVAGLKFSLRCDRCKLNYNYDRYGNRARGWCLYEGQRPLVEASDVCFVDRKLLEFQCALANHSWVSFSGFSTAYNEVFQLLSKGGEYGEKQCASAFWNGELELELRELGSLDFFGMMKKNEDREKVMEEVDKIRAKGVYSHSSDDCSDACKARGCGRLWVIDGQWKLMFSHCMMQRKNFIRGLPLLNYPNVCTNSPQFGKAF